MKSYFRVSVIVVIITLTSMVGNVLIQAHQMEIDKTSAVAISNPATFPWRGQYVHRVLNPPMNVGLYPTLIFRSDIGTPMIIYYNSTLPKVMEARPHNWVGLGNCGENNNWDCYILDYWLDYDIGRYASIDMWSNSFSWKMGLGYYDATRSALIASFHTCVGDSCTFDNSVISLPGGNNISVGLFTTFKYNTNGIPYISYYVSNSNGVDSLMIAHLTPDATGNCGVYPYDGIWQCDVIDSGEGVGQYTSLDIAWDNQLYVAYYDVDQGNIKYAYYAGIGNCGTNNEWYCTTLDGTNGSNVGLYASLKAPRFSGDLLCIAYYDKTNGNLKYYDNSGWKVAVDHMGTSLTNMGISMDIDKAGYPAIAYQQIASDLSRPVLRFVRPYLAYNDGAFGNCGDVPPGYAFLYWRCTTLDNTSQYTSEADYVPLAINSSGYASIAYSEGDDYNNITSLKYIYQVSQIFLSVLSR